MISQSARLTGRDDCAAAPAAPVRGGREQSGSQEKKPALLPGQSSRLGHFKMAAINNLPGNSGLLLTFS